MLCREAAAVLGAARRPRQQPLAVLAADLATCSTSQAAGEAAARHAGLVCLANTGLGQAAARRDSAWPQYSHIRRDAMCGGLVLHHHNSLRVVEVSHLASSDSSTRVFQYHPPSPAAEPVPPGPVGGGVGRAGEGEGGGALDGRRLPRLPRH